VTENAGLGLEGCDGFAIWTSAGTDDPSLRLDRDSGSLSGFWTLSAEWGDCVIFS
jgi:hypothetical protein